jgi:hypothetical protein
MPMKTVLIVGAGPAGLVTAKTLLRWTETPFKVTVFEAAERVGGMWRAKKEETGNKCSPEMRTNLSRFTVAFPDLPWQSVPLDTDDGYSGKASPAMFPKAYQVGKYLDEYTKKFIPKDVIVCNRRVVGAKLDEGPRKWNVTSLNTVTKTEYEDIFDYLIIASGFFDQPDRTIPDNAASKGFPTGVQHSADFRHVSTFGDTTGNIVVIGGGISGSEAAATVASQISNAKYAPGKAKPAWSESKVYHAFDRPFYVLPRYIPQDPYNVATQNFNIAPKFIPVDLNLYNLTRRGSGDIIAVNGQVPPERAKKTHEFLKVELGGDLREFGYTELAYKPEQTDFPAFTGISDTYTEFVRSGLIVPVQGRASKSVDGNGHAVVEVSQTGSWTSAFSSSEQQPTTIKQLAGIIEATGFQAHLDYLSDSVKNTLNYDPECHRLPFLLSRGSIFSPAISELAFVGFYEGPYWGVMEMQARTIAQAWDSGHGESLSTEEAARVREGIKRRDLDIPQFWMADYVGLIEEFSRNAGCRRNDSCFNGQTGPAFPARYTGPGSDLNSAEKTVREVRDLLDASENEARFVPAAAFRAMQGTWTLHRKIDSRHPSSPGGVLKGTAQFHPREPTEPHFSAEYLYTEEGTFTMDNGYSFPAKRRYIYRYSEAKDAITAWFVQEDGETVEKFFNELVFEEPKSDEHGWVANGKHWCEPDNYVSKCEFRFRGCGLDSLGITYEVKGPNKDYTHESWYKRPR